MKNTSWKTTLIGAIIAICVAIQPLISTGKIDWKSVGIAALIALFGYISKDSNVTGGNVSNNLTLKS
jgi:hypothetical protein